MYRYGDHTTYPSSDGTYPHPKPADYSQKNPYATEAHNKLLELSASMGWPKHYQNDLYHHDWVSLRDAQVPITRFIWSVRESGTDLILYAPPTTCDYVLRHEREHHLESCYSPITVHNDWLTALLMSTEPRLFYLLERSTLVWTEKYRWRVTSLPHSMPECLAAYRNLAPKPAKESGND